MYFRDSLMLQSTYWLPSSGLKREARNEHVVARQAYSSVPEMKMAWFLALSLYLNLTVLQPRRLLCTLYILYCVVTWFSMFPYKTVITHSCIHN
jgi:hypothetical protein